MLVFTSIIPVNSIAQETNLLSNMNWLLGNWTSESDSEIIKEKWEKVSSNTFEGFGETLDSKSNNITGSESLRILEMSGEIFYLAKVSHNKIPVAFRLINQTDSTLVFENPDHDFPKQITYIRENESSMHVVVGEGEKSFIILFHRE